MDPEGSTKVARRVAAKPLELLPEGRAAPAKGSTEVEDDRRFPFTVNALKALQPKAKRYVVHDSGSNRSTRGLVLFVEPSGAKSFYWYRKVDGRPERVRIGEFPAWSIEGARGKAAAHNQTHAAGNNPAADRREMSAESTLAELFKRYLELHALPAKKPSSVAADQWLWKSYLEPWAGNRKLSSIRKADVAALLADVAEKHGKTAANNALALLRHMLNKGIEWGWKAKHGNPAAGIKRFKVPSRSRYLQADEVRRLLETLRAERDDRARDFVLLALLTGARRSNVAAMAWAELDLDGATWHCRDTKGGPQDIPLVPAAVALLRARKAALEDLAATVEARQAAGEVARTKRQAARWAQERVLAEKGKTWVLPSTGELGHYREPKRAWKAILQRAGIDSGVRIHDLRRTAGSWSAALGTSVVVLQKTLGHRDIDSTMVYTRLPLDPVRAAMEKTASALLGTTGLAADAEVVRITAARGEHA